MKAVLGFLLGVACFYGSVRTTSSSLKTVFDTTLGICIPPVVLGFLGIRKRIVHQFNFFKLRLTRKKLRISFAGLVRIVVDGEYLLVKSTHTGKWQPVGGVIRYYDRKYLEDLGLKNDPHMNPKDEPEFRMIFPPESTHNAIALMDWFESRKGREVTPTREFCEELIAENILSQKFSAAEFKFVDLKYLYGFSDEFQVHELFAFEIFEFVPNHEQLAELRVLKNQRRTDVLFLSEDVIIRNGYVGPGVKYELSSQTREII